MSVWKTIDKEAVLSGLSAADLREQAGLDPGIYPNLGAGAAWQAYKTGSGASALAGADTLCYVAGSSLVVGDTAAALGLSQGRKKIASLGSMLVVYPDKKYVDTADPAVWGSLDAVYSGSVSVSLCDEAGGGYSPTVSASAPESPSPGALWLDTSGVPVLMRYSSAASRWVSQDSFLKLAASGLSGFRAGDRVQISGISGLSGSHTLLAVGSGFLVVAGSARIPGSVENAAISRKAPLLDYITQAGGRLWGCRRGEDPEGKQVTCLYATRPGDIFNWELCIPVECPGAFTGAGQLDDKAVFFQENAVHTASRNGSVRTVLAPGVTPGGDGTVAAAAGKLLYRGADGIYAFNAAKSERLLALPEAGGGAAASLAGRYFLSFEAEGRGHFLAYDAGHGVWLRRDDTLADDLCAAGDTLYALTGGDILSLQPGSTAGDGVWRARLSVTDAPCWLTGVSVYGRFPAGSVLRAAYDAGDGPRELGILSGPGRRRHLTVLPRSCGRLDILLEGSGGVCVESVTAHIQSPG